MLCRVSFVIDKIAIAFNRYAVFRFVAVELEVFDSYRKIRFDKWRSRLFIFHVVDPLKVNYRVRALIEACRT